MKKILTIIIATLFGGAMLFNWNELGKSPSGDDLARILLSENYHSEQGVFVNRKNSLLTTMKKSNFDWKLIKDWFTPKADRTPSGKPPELKPDLNEFLKDSNELKAIWFGHSTFLLNISGNIILVDPVFSKAASPIKSLVKRFQKPVLELDELPKVDYILISHDHYDHLDMQSIQFFADKEVKFITPLGVGSHLKNWGVAENKIIEKDWWQTAKFASVKFTATPAQHFSGRKGFDANSTLWASWVITSGSHNIYFSGDSGYGPHFKEIGDRYGPFDVAFIESGQYNENWQDVHMQPSEGVQAFKDLKANKYFPIHWGMFELALHTWYDPIEQLYKFSIVENFDLLAPKIGQIVNIDHPDTLDNWWHRVALTQTQKGHKTEQQANLEQKIGQSSRNISASAF